MAKQMTAQQETALNCYLDNLIKEIQQQSTKAGADAILKTILNMCNDGKSIDDIRTFCMGFLDINN